MLPNFGNYIETGGEMNGMKLLYCIICGSLYIDLQADTSYFFGCLKIWTCALRTKEKKHEDVTISSVAANASRSKAAVQATGVGFSLTLRPVTLVQFQFNWL